MIVTLTPNPSLDRAVTLPDPLLREAVNHLGSVTVEPDEKGVNVARVLASSGQEAMAFVPATSDGPLLRVIDSLGLPGPACQVVPVAGAARINTAVTEPDRTTTRLNESGASLSEAETAAVEAALSEGLHLVSDGHSWAVLSGSPPPRAPVDWYVRLVSLLRPLDVRVAVDASDAPLATLAANLPGCAPGLIKPSGQELAQLADRGATGLEGAAAAGDFGPMAEAARILVELRIGAVLATPGPAGGVPITDEGAWHATTPSVPVVSTVGTGDSPVAEFILTDVRGDEQAECPRTAMACDSVAASLPGTALPTSSDLPVQVFKTARLD